MYPSKVSCTENWKTNRQAEYPTHEDCIHALLDGGDTLTELQEKRQAVKNKYPKPQDSKMQLSKHFKLEEFTKSMTATRKNIDRSKFQS